MTEKTLLTWWLARRAGKFAALGILVAGGLLACSPQGSTPERDDQRLTDQLDELIQETTDKQTLDPVARIEEKTYSDDARGQAELFVTSVFNEQVAMRNEYMAQLREIGWESVLDPTRLKADAGLVETNRMVSRAKDNAEQMCAQIRPRAEAHARTVAARLKLSQKDKQDILDGFIKGMNENAATTDEICRLEVAIVDEIAGVVAVFAQDPAWQLQDNMFMFSEDRYVEEFNTRMQNVQALTEAQTGLQQRTMSEASGSLREMGL